MSETPPRKEAILWGEGYVTDPVGIRVWPLRKHRHKWADLEAIEFGGRYYNSRWRFALSLHFRGPKRRKISLSRGSSSKDLAIVIRLLTWVKTKAPGAAKWDDPDIQDLFAAARAVENPAPFEGSIADDTRLRRAKLRLAAWNVKGTIEDCDALITANSRHEVAAVRLKMWALLCESRLDDAVETLGRLVQRHPDELEARTDLAVALLDGDDKRGTKLTNIILEKRPGGSPRLLFALAHQAMRRKDWVSAEDYLARIAAHEPHLSIEEQEALAKRRSDIARYRGNPRLALKELTAPIAFAKARMWLVIAILIAVFGTPLVLVVPVFARESWNLWQLRANGVRAALVDIHQRTDRRDSSYYLEEIHYLFAPDASKAVPLSSDGLERGSEAWKRWYESLTTRMQNLIDGGSLEPEGWIRGRAILFSSSAEEIHSSPLLQFVTYLPSDPEISTIGPITNNRIWFTWIGAPKAMLPVVIGLIMFGAFVIERFRRRLRRRSHGYEI